MPFFRYEEKLIYFAHVPKCAGTSIEHYLSQRFGPLAFLDEHYLALDPDKRWNVSSPQHVPAHALARLFPDGFFDASFAVVRHPAERFHSAFHFQKQMETIHRRMPLSVWLRYFESRLFPGHARYDNHFLPQAAFVPEGARVFRLEDGLQALVDHIDDLVGNSDGPREIGRVNTGVGQGALTPGQIERIRRIYSEDFERFGYD